MMKITLLASLIAGLAMGTNIAANSRVAPLAKRDAQIIVEVDHNGFLTKEGIGNTQKAVLQNIRLYATSNFKVLSSYSEVANAFAISVNSDTIELIKKVPGVKSVTVNKLHWVTQSVPSYTTTDDESSEYGGSDNISAETMNKGETNDGAGTTIAILDNEFYLRGKVDDDAAWHHATYTAFDDDDVLKHKDHPEGWTDTFAYKTASTLLGSSPASVEKGAEGSLYFNSKVPFYFDYGGETEAYAADPDPDLDVSSEISYHGSHVASIASGNDPIYKGIAPKAQLICMKVFTNYKANPVDRLLGLSSSSGAYDIPIMNALEDCIKLNVDGINMSLGSNLNDFDKDTITRKTLTKLANSGILTSISAGNSGKQSYQNTGAYSNWTSEMAETGILSGYSNDSAAMTIASGQPTKVFYKNAFVLANSDIVAYDDQIVNREGYGDDYDVEYKMADLGSTLNWVYVSGFGTSSDYKTDPDNDVSGKVAVVNRGSTSFLDKYNVAKSKGAIGLIVINNDPTSNDFNFRMSFGEGFRPSMPCAIVLYKDKEMFSSKRFGTLDIISNFESENPKALTVSTFSTDGATYDLDLKPEITAPGDLIKGAVPPQKKTDKDDPDRRFNVYEFLSGTSMSAPNYAGAQSVVLSKFAKNAYDPNVSAEDKLTAAQVAEKRGTVDMRLMSTATPMMDTRLKYGEDGKEESDYFKTPTSPRRQGAGMVNLGDAYATDVYVEGLDLNGNGIKKSKIALRNSEKINNGIIDLPFIIHNDDSVAHSYDVTFSVMIPSVVKNNEIFTKDYKQIGDVEAIADVPGATYYLPNIVPGATPYERHSEKTAVHMDAINVTRDIEYYASAADCLADKKSVIKKNRYYNASETGISWEELPALDYQSIYDDVLVESFSAGTITANPGSTLIDNLNTYELSAEQKQNIWKFYEYGCFIEGYVTLTCKDNNQPNLSVPYMGFFGGEGKDYGDAPVFEPFDFEKDSSKIYPSDLVNDIAKSLLGKDKADMGSMWVAGYLKDGKTINKDEIASNENNFANLSGFYRLGLDGNGNHYSDAANHLYVGSSYYTNTMIIQQFMLRSCQDNYFTITNKETGKEVYRSALEDIIRGDVEFGIYSLFKSHIDDSYLGAGYVSHRAYAIVPLYDENGIAFASGDYEVKFNYLLSATGEWVDSIYTLHIDSDSPEVSSITEHGDNVRINIKERNLTGVTVGRQIKYLKDVSGMEDSLVKVNEDESYIEIAKSEIDDILMDPNQGFNNFEGSGRLFIKLTDAAHGQMGVLVRFETDANDNTLFNKYVLVENHSLTISNDFLDDGANIQIVEVSNNPPKQTVVTDLEGPVLISRGPVRYSVVTSNGCGGNIQTTSVVLSTLALLALAGIAISQIRRREIGGNK